MHEYEDLGQVTCLFSFLFVCFNSDIHANSNQKTQNSRELGLEILPVTAGHRTKPVHTNTKKVFFVLQNLVRELLYICKQDCGKAINLYLHLIICVDLTNKKNLMALSDQIILNHFTMKNDYGLSLPGNGGECIKLCNIQFYFIIHKTHLSKIQDLIHQF